MRIALLSWSFLGFASLVSAQVIGPVDPQYCPSGSGLGTFVFTGYPWKALDVFERSDGNRLLVGTSAYWNANITTVLIDAQGRAIQNYGRHGVRSTEVTTISANNTAAPVALRSDDRLVGAARDWQNHSRLFRLNADGSLDESFGGTEGLEIMLDGEPTIWRNLAVLPDDRILLGGELVSTSLFVVARLLPDGQLDTSFGTNGWTALTGRPPCQKLEVLPDGRCLAGAGSAAAALSQLLMFDQNGHLDPSFMGTGILTGFVQSGFQYATEYVYYPDGRLLLCNDSRRFRLLADGSAADPTFPNSFQGTRNTILLPDGRVLFLLTTTAPNWGRLQMNGLIDPTFGNAGWVDFDNLFSQVHIKALSDGSYLCYAGRAFNQEENEEVVLQHYSADGQLDTGFGANGTAHYHGLGLGVDLCGFATDPQARTAVVTYGSGGAVGAVARFDANGEPDPAFHVTGTAEPWDLYSHALAFQHDGTLMIGSEIPNFAPLSSFMQVDRISPAGDVEPGGGPYEFAGYDGWYNTITDMVVAPGDVTYLSASLTNYLSGIYPGSLGLMKLDPSGGQDMAFGANGQFIHELPVAGVLARRLAILPNGDLLTVGLISDPPDQDVPFSNQLLLMRVSPSGALVTSWGIDGTRTTDLNGTAQLSLGSVDGLHVYPDGRFLIYYVGRRDDGSGNYLARFTADGLLDPSFGVAGVAVVSLEEGSTSTTTSNTSMLAVRPDGRILTVLVDPYSRLRFQQVLPDGTPDNAFGGDGVVFGSDTATSYMQQALLTTDATGRVLVGGRAYFSTAAPYAASENFLFRLSDDFSTDLGDVTKPGDVSGTVFPNPVQDHLTVNFDLRTTGPVRIELLDAQGRRVQDLLNGQRQAGTHQETIAMSHGLAAGTYLLRLITRDGARTTRLIVGG